MHCLKKNVIDVCAAERTPLNLKEKAVCAGELNLVCASEAPSVISGVIEDEG